MKNSLRHILVCLSFIAASFTYGAGMPTMDVTVSDPGGKVAFKGKTRTDGTFATGTLAPGNYVVQFNSNSAGSNHYTLIVSAGSAKVVAESVAAGKFANGGVAMRVNVGKGLNITGQVSSGKVAAASKGDTSGNVKVKVMNGKRYVWVAGSTGSNLGGHWAEEGSTEAQNIVRGNAEGFRQMQDKATQDGRGN